MVQSTTLRPSRSSSWSAIPSTSCRAYYAAAAVQSQTSASRSWPPPLSRSAVGCSDERRGVLRGHQNRQVSGTPSETPRPESPVVEFTDDGFQPEETRGRGRAAGGVRQPVWTRSSGPRPTYHPTHEILSELDAGRLLRDQASHGRSRFRTPGFWRYHNHADPQHGGLIVVRGGGDRGQAASPRGRHVAA